MRGFSWPVVARLILALLVLPALAGSSDGRPPAGPVAPRFGGGELRPAQGACMAPGAGGRVFHVDPVHGRDDGDGSAARPWRSLAALLDGQRIGSLAYRALSPAPGQPRPWLAQPQPNPRVLVGEGDTLLLHSGDYGVVRLMALANRRYLTIAAAPGATPRLSALLIQGASGFVLRGLTVTGALGRDRPGWLVQARSIPEGPATRDIRLDRLTVGGDAAIGKVAPARWADQGFHGVILQGDCLELANARIHDVRNAVSLYAATRSRVVGNAIDGFSIDGIDYLGRDLLVSGNIITDHHANGDGFHPDCIQGQSDNTQPELGPATIAGNVCVARTRALEPGEYIQGITLFNGRWRNVAVRCNLVLTRHWHGIALYGVDGAEVAGNVVLSQDSARPAWIRAQPGADGHPPSANLLRDNQAQAFPDAAPGLSGTSRSAGVSLRGNRVVSGAVAVAPGISAAPEIPPMSVAEARRRFPLPAMCRR